MRETLWKILLKNEKPDFFFLKNLSILKTKVVWSKQIQRSARKNRFKGGVILSLTVFLSLSLFSYNPQDPSLNSFGLSLKVTNYCGFIGSSLADLLYQLFGFSSWFLILGGLFLSYKFLINQIRGSFLNSCLLFGLFLLSFSSLSALHFPETHFYNGEILLGGAFGQFIVSSLKPLFHTTGSAVLLWSALILTGLFYSQNFFSSFIWFFPQKILMFFIFLFKNISSSGIFLFQKLRQLYQKSANFSKILRDFMKKSFLYTKSFLLKIKASRSASSTNSSSEINSTEKKPRFVFKEKSIFTIKKNRSSPLGKSPSKEITTASSNSDEQAEEELMPSLESAESIEEEGIPSLEKQAFSNEINKLSLESEKPANSNASSLNSGEEAGHPKEINTASSNSKPANKQSNFPFLKKNPFAGSPLPPLDILSDKSESPEKISPQDIEDLSKKLLDKMSQFSIKGEITAVKTGPALALFEFKPEDHVKVSRIREMGSDLSLALSSESVRIIAPIPGRDVVGIEASMPYREMVYLKNLLKEESFLKTSLPLVLGRRADNQIGIKDLSRIPHLLVAGTTGSGKSMFIISFVTSLLFRHTPESLRMILIDPKQVDLSAFKDIPHLISPIVTSSTETVRTLQWAIMEMEKRYRSLAHFKARDHLSFNKTVKNMSLKEKKLHEEKNELASAQDSYYFESLPLICIVIEEFGDLMADRNIRRAVENSVVRLAQKARASGIHLVLAMQSPRKDVLTGLIKTNIPGRISFKVASGTDSRVILDETGAERLLSHGDMLFLEPGNPKPVRYHGPYVREKDVQEIGNYWRDQGEPFYEEAFLNGSEKKDFTANDSQNEYLNMKEDPMYKEILDFVKTRDVVSASFLQRKFRIGYPRAARMIEILFEEGQIGPPQGSKPREVLINK